VLRFVGNVLGGLFTTVTLGLIFAALTLGGIFYMYSRDLPSHENLAQYTPATISRIYSGEGRIIDEFARERRLFVPADEIPDLVKQAKSLGMNALALTDHGNLFGAIEFYKVCKEVGIKPIVGIEAYLAPKSRFDKEQRAGEASYHITLLAHTREGYENLMKLSSSAYLEGFHYKPRVDRELLAWRGVPVRRGCASAAISAGCHARDVDRPGIR